MAYEQYKTIRSYQQFINSWDAENIAQMTDEQQADAYNKYVLKCAVFQRDNFTCQNEECSMCNNVPEIELTLHHIKFKKNNGKDKLNNGITVCLSSHRRFHRGKDSLTFWGMTYTIHQEEYINWKVIRKENKKIRKNWKQINPEGVYVSWELIYILMRFLNTPYYELNKSV